MPDAATFIYRPLKQPVTIRLDADVLAWFKEHAPAGGYQPEINRVLRTHVTESEKRTLSQQSPLAVGELFSGESKASS